MTGPKYYKVKRKDLLELLEAAHKLWALENGGVDDWEWCGESQQDYLMQYLEEHYSNLSPSQKEDFSFFDIAETEIEKFKEVK